MSNGPIAKIRRSLARLLSEEERGVAMAEFIIVFPLQFLFILGIMQLALIYVAHQVVNHAAFMGARAALVADQNGKLSERTAAEKAAVFVCSAIAGESLAAGGGQPIQVPGWGRLNRSRAAQAKTRITGNSEFEGKAIVVEVEHDYELIIPVVNRIFAFPWESFIYGDDDPNHSPRGRRNQEASRRHSRPGTEVPHFVIRENCWMTRPWSRAEPMGPGSGSVGSGPNGNGNGPGNGNPNIPLGPVTGGF